MLLRIRNFNRLLSLKYRTALSSLRLLRLNNDRLLSDDRRLLWLNIVDLRRGILRYVLPYLSDLSYRNMDIV